MEEGEKGEEEGEKVRNVEKVKKLIPQTLRIKAKPFCYKRGFDEMKIKYGRRNLISFISFLRD